MTLRAGLKNLITDVAGFHVGNARDDDLKSGVTVFTSDTPFVASVDVMGAAPGTRETDLLDVEKTVQAVDALVLSGGSAFGLDAASGVVDGLRADGRGFVVGSAIVPIVPSAILFDLLNGGNKGWVDNPYRDLGRAAYANASNDFDLGSEGAGTGALTAMNKGGLGSASFVLPSGIIVGALVAVNPIGSVTTPSGKHFWAAPFEMNNEFGGHGVDPSANLCTTPISLKHANLNGNTTIAIVATDAVLSKAQAKRMAVSAQDGMARAIVPAHTLYDGDLVFGAASNRIAMPNPDVDMMQIGAAAAHCLTRAIARGVYQATPMDGDTLACWKPR